MYLNELYERIKQTTRIKQTEYIIKVVHVVCFKTRSEKKMMHASAKRKLKNISQRCIVFFLRVVLIQFRIDNKLYKLFICTSVSNVSLVAGVGNFFYYVLVYKILFHLHYGNKNVLYMYDSFRAYILRRGEKNMIYDKYSCVLRWFKNSQGPLKKSRM